MSEEGVYEEDRPKVWFHPPALLFTAIVAGYAVRLFAGGWLPIPQALGEGLGVLLICASMFIMIGAVRLFGETGEELQPASPSHQLIQQGPFARSRNPIYLAFMLFGVGLGFATLNLWMIVTTLIVGLFINFLIIKPEERYLEDRFGNEYLEYKKRVRRWI